MIDPNLLMVSNGSQCRATSAVPRRARTERAYLARGRRALLSASLSALSVSLGLVLLAASGSAQTLLLRYSFDEASSGTGIAYDSSGAAPEADGNFMGAATRTTATIGGSPVAALDTVGGTGYVSAGNVAKLDGLQQMTVTAWIKCTGAPANGQAIMGKMAPGTPTQGWALLFGVNSAGGIAANAFSIKFKVNGTTSGTSGDIGADNSWVFVAATYDGSQNLNNVKFYTGRSGSAVAAYGTKSSTAGTPAVNADSFRVPSIGSSAQPPPLVVDDVRVYSGVLTQTQLEAIRAGNFPPTLAWDVDGTPAGAGGSGAPAGTWSGSGVWALNKNWSSSTNGDLPGQQWSEGSVAVFAAGTDATGSYTVTVTDNPSASAVNVEEGAVTFNGSSVTLMGNKSIDVASGASATFDSTTLAGSGGFAKTGSGTLTLGQANSISGYVTVSGGTLALGPSGALNNCSVVKVTHATTYDVSAVSGGYVVVSGQTLKGQGTVNGPVTIANGATLAPGGSVGTINFNSSLTVAGNLEIEVDKSLSPANDNAVVAGSLLNTGTGTVTVTNVGTSALGPGDRFVLFNKPLVNGGALSVVSDGGLLWTNKLAVDGSIEVLPNGPTTPPYLQVTVSGSSSLNFSWTNVNVKLQAQTNAAGLQSGDAYWFDYPNGASSPVVVPIDPASKSVFFRLRAQ